MDKFTVKITYKNGKQEITYNVISLTYTQEFIGNKWDLYLDITAEKDNNPNTVSYHYIKHNLIDRVLILNSTKEDSIHTLTEKEYQYIIYELNSLRNGDGG